MDDLLKSTAIATAGMKAQSERLRVISENVANADSTATTPDGLPYRRKIVNFKNELDHSNGLNLVKVGQVRADPSDFNKRYDPKHPAADREGYVLTPNVNTMVEMMDMREAQRSYEANMNVIKISSTMLSQTVQLLK